MDEEIETLTVGVRADLSRFAKDVAEMRGQLEGPLVHGAETAGRAIESGLLRAARTGRLGFEDLGKAALAVMGQIAAAAVRDGLGALGLAGGSGGNGLGGGLLRLGSALLGSALGLPGRATGGPVAPGRAYLVGERGPEVFLPTSSGQVMPGAGGAGSGGRDVRVSITVNGSGQDTPRALARSARQVARAVRGALAD
ncbi:MAG TPA: tail tape measure protein [Sphingobium sp.]|nr:tail tape measure protein [Sphingobium sp.]